MKTGPLDQSLVVALPAGTAPVPAVPLDLQTLFKMHAGYVWNSLRRLGVRPADLEDLTHDVFLQVHKHTDQFDASRAVRPWLFGFAFRLASQYRRRAFRRFEQPGEVDAAADSAPSPERDAQTADDLRLVRHALATIPLDRRAVFVLYAIDGARVEEIAENLGIPINTVYSRLRTARIEFNAAIERFAPKGVRREP
jgi:RNA polymerase sigma-70 factor (ECF subfamily)